MLLVEDQPLEAIEYRDRLRHAGAQIVGPVPSVREALACLSRDKIDVAVLDHALADSNSLRLQEALERGNIPYVILTGYPSVLVRRTTAQTILAKPVPTDLLCKTVSAVCGAE